VAAKGKIPTEDMLKRRNFSYPSRCYICLEEEEFVIISLCIVGGFLCFGIYLSLLGVSWAQPSSVRDVIVAWRSRMKKSWVLGVWNMIPWAIW